MPAILTATRRQILFGTAIGFLALPDLGLRPTLAANPTVLKRKNIDMLSPDELNNYKHAVNILKERSKTNPTAPDGYLYQANLHNKVRIHPDNTRGACEHASEQFFPWHRAHVAGFEQLLQKSDPPRTANITIPYWDWTRAPTGRLFPTAFEDQTSPLYDDGRVTDGSPPMWDAEDIRGMVREPEWDLFAGRPKANASSGSVEMGPHNTMHGNIGPTMAAPRTASNDPIFWSFHAYIDLIWGRWQRLHNQTFACGSCKFWLEPNSYSVDQTKNISDFLYDYDYDFTPDGPTVVLVASAPTSAPLSTLRFAPRSASGTVKGEPSPRRKLLKIEKVRPLTDVTYRLQVYLHPAEVNAAGLSEDQRRQYLVKTLTVWQSAGHHPEAFDVTVDLTPTLAKNAGNRVVTVLTEGAPSAKSASERNALKARLDTRLPAARELFQGLSIEER